LLNTSELAAVAPVTLRTVRSAVSAWQCSACAEAWNGIPSPSASDGTYAKSIGASRTPSRGGNAGLGKRARSSGRGQTWHATLSIYKNRAEPWGSPPRNLPRQPPAKCFPKSQGRRLAKSYAHSQIETCSKEMVNSRSFSEVDGSQGRELVAPIGEGIKFKRKS